jgi:arginine:pyruvate transaminase
MKFASITNRLATLGSDKWAVHIEGRRRAAKGEKLIFLSIGEPDLPPPQAVIDVAKANMVPGKLGYVDGVGSRKAREALARHYTVRADRAIAPAQFMLLPGTQTALYVAMQTVVDPGDEVLLLDPYYATYEAVVTAPGGVPVPVALDPDRNFHINFAALEKAVTPRTRAILLNTPSNPTGAVFTQEEISKLGTFAKKHDLWIVSDEVYATMVHGEHVFASPFLNADFEERTLVVSSISKSHALPGFRAGWIASSETVIARALPIAESMLFSTVPFLGDALAAALDGDFAETRMAKQAYAARAETLIRGLRNSNRVKAHLPEGGMFTMVDVRATGLSGEDFARRLLAEEGVVTMPGESFGACGAGHLRVAMTVDEESMAEAAQRIVRLADRI